MPDQSWGYIVPDGPFKGKEIVWAGQDQIHRYPNEVDRVLEALGHPEALVTDLSTVRDFCGSEDLPALTAALGVPVELTSTIWQLAEALWYRP